MTGAAEVIAPLRSELGLEAVLEKLLRHHHPGHPGQDPGQWERHRGAPMSKRDFLSIDDVDPGELVALLDGPTATRPTGAPRHPGRPLGPRLREALHPDSGLLRGRRARARRLPSSLGRGRAPARPGRDPGGHRGFLVLSRYVHAIVLRTFAQESLERLARGGSIPVVNALSDYSTPARPWPTSRPSASARAAWPASAWPTWATATTSPTACCSPGPRWACTWPWPPARLRAHPRWSGGPPRSPG